jgi:hypothetical protein
VEGWYNLFVIRHMSSYITKLYYTTAFEKG